MSNAQNNGIKSDFKICEESFYFQTLWPMFGRSFVKEHFKVDSTSSYFNYIDQRTNESYLRVGIESSDTIAFLPTQYVLILNVMHRNQEIGFFKVDCHYQNNSIRADKWVGLKEYLKPQIKVIEGKAIDLEKALDIAEKDGYDTVNLTVWEIDYEKKKGTNDYKKFFPRLVWTLKKPVDIGRINVIQINAKSGKVLKKYIEYNID